MERVIQGTLPGYAVSGAARVLLFLAGEELVAVACHHALEWPALPIGIPAPMGWAGGAVGTEVLVLGVALGFQGSRLDDPHGQRLSDYVLETTLRDALTCQWDGPASALIAPDNHRSLNSFPD